MQAQTPELATTQWMTMLSTPLPAPVLRQTRHSRYAIASALDREALEATPLGALTTFVASDGRRLRLANTFPLVAVAASQEGATALGAILQQLQRMRTVPEIPVKSPACRSMKCRVL